jgi:methionyl-tRNA formyltransferase
MTKIVVCGIQQQSIEIIDYLKINGITVTHIVTIDYLTALKNNCESTLVSFEEYAKQNEIELYYAKSYSLKHKRDVEYFTGHRFDILLLGGWQRIISQEILSTLTYGGIGQHGSSEFLPKNRGRSPLNWSILLGKKRLIWNIFFLDCGTDSGDIIDYQIFDIRECDDCKTLYYKVSASVKRMYARSIPRILDRSLCAIKQVGDPTYYDKRSADDGYIDWNKSVHDIDRLIRAVTKPYPGAFTMFEGHKIFIWKAQVWDTQLDFYYNSDYGEIVEVFGNDFVVKCSEGLLLVTEHEDNCVFLGKMYDTSSPA